MRYQAALRPDRSAGPYAAETGFATSIAMTALLQPNGHKAFNSCRAGLNLLGASPIFRFQPVSGPSSKSDTMFATQFLMLGAAAPGGGGAFMASGLIPMILIFVVFWFLLIRPQQKQMKEHRAKIEAAKKGDSVVTGGGLLGKITKVEGDTVEVEIANGIKVRAVKSTLSDVTSNTPGKPAND
jgi:preprotein translocase subunit YajC